MTPTQLSELSRVCKEMQRWHDEDLAHEQECMSCGSPVHCPSHLEPTPLCDLCAQRLAGDVPGLLDELRRLREIAQAAIAWREATYPRSRSWLAATTADMDLVSAVDSFQSKP